MSAAFDHRAEAVRLLAVANDRHADADPEGAAIFTQQAQVHATLALAAERDAELQHADRLIVEGYTELCAAVRAVLDNAPQLSTDAVAALRALVGGAA